MFLAGNEHSQGQRPNKECPALATMVEIVAPPSIGVAMMAAIGGFDWLPALDEGSDPWLSRVVGIAGGLLLDHMVALGMAASACCVRRPAIGDRGLSFPEGSALWSDGENSLCRSTIALLGAVDLAAVVSLREILASGEHWRFLAGASSRSRWAGLNIACLTLRRG